MFTYYSQNKFYEWPSDYFKQIQDPKQRKNANNAAR